ncbi:MAG: hypothetical protein ABSG11_21990 [Candidatus Korobacteraceae bacterium]
MEKLINNEMQRASLLVALMLSVFAAGCGSSPETPPPAPPQLLETGWVISFDTPAVILHTADGGQHWNAQGDSSVWAGCSGEDINAVDDDTAWATVGCVARQPAATYGQLCRIPCRSLRSTVWMPLDSQAPTCG